MTVRGSEFHIGRISSDRVYLFGKPAHVCRGKEKIRPDTNKQRLAAHAVQRGLERGIALAHIIQIHGAADVEVTIGIEALDQRIALVVQVTLHIKALDQVGIAAGRSNIDSLSLSSGETQLHRLLTLVGNHRQHPCDRKPSIRPIVGRVIALLPAWVAHNRLSLHLAEGHPCAVRAAVVAATITFSTSSG